MDTDTVVGFGFHPTNAELINHHLRKKLLDPDFTSKKIREIRFYNHEPSELPGLALVQVDAPVWYFYVALDYQNTNSKRANRRTRGGTWKVTGKEREIKDSRTKKVIGTKRTLVFYKGRTTTKEARTNWVMHEYRCKPDPLFKGEFVLVRIKIKPNYRSEAPSSSESAPSYHLTSDSGDHTAEVSQVESLPLPNNHVYCNSKAHTANVMFSKDSQSPPNNGICFNSHSDHGASINGESELLTNHGISIDGESQLLPNESNMRNSQLAAQPEFNDEEIGGSLFPNFYSSKPVTGAFDCDATDADAEALAALLDGFSSMANGEYDFNSLCEPQSCLAVNENIVPGQMGSVV